jgi:5-(carboxyamino)imidazole ribonucleotide synthase
MLHDQPQIGILGAGQLSRYLAEAATRYGYEVRVLCQSLEEPAAQLSVARSVDRQTEESRDFFLSGLKLVLFENEFINGDRFRASRFQPEAFPSWESVSALSWKNNQKKLLDRLKIPTARWLEMNDADPEDWLVLVLQEFSGRAVIKWGRLGYDGYGNFVIQDVSQLAAAKEFILRARELSVPVFAEEFIDFEKEFSLVSCRSREGTLSFFPVVLSEQKSAACFKVLGPAKEFGFSEAQEERARSWAQQISESSGLMGVFAVELFWSARRGLLVNEIAPRVHNTGHFSLSSANLSQFDLQILSAMNQPLPDLETRAFFGMLNLLGPREKPSCPPIEGPPLEQTEFFWYGKRDLKPGRKMGHINFWAKTKTELLDLEAKLMKWEREVWQNFGR